MTGKTFFMRQQEVSMANGDVNAETGASVHMDALEYQWGRANAIMQHLDRTWWIGGDVPDQLHQLRVHLVAAVNAVDALLALTQDEARR